jgi:peptidoglycan/xylan/chitin deacetylase (PgdA/CDA1 family)
MRYLADQGFHVLPLDEAIDRLERGTLPPDAVTITIDDGFHSTHAVAREVLAGHRFPSTLYLTSYYFQKATPIFRLAVDYMCWKAQDATVDLSGLGVPALADATALELTHANRVWASTQIYTYGSIALDEDGRVALSRKLGECLGIDYEEIAASRMLSLVSPEEVRELEASGMAIEMHTHRHHFPDSPAAAHLELEQNRSVVEPVIGRRMRHFCYPSGVWSEAHHPVLAANGVRSATTCISGLTHRGDHLLALPRILDDGRVSQIEFEAEMSGFIELVRRRRSPIVPVITYPSFIDFLSTHGSALALI